MNTLPYVDLPIYVGPSSSFLLFVLGCGVRQLKYCVHCCSVLSFIELIANVNDVGVS